MRQASSEACLYNPMPPSPPQLPPPPPFHRSPEPSLSSLLPAGHVQRLKKRLSASLSLYLPPLSATTTTTSSPHPSSGLLPPRYPGAKQLFGPADRLAEKDLDNLKRNVASMAAATAQLRLQRQNVSINHIRDQEVVLERRRTSAKISVQTQTDVAVPPSGWWGFNVMGSSGVSRQPSWNFTTATTSESGIGGDDGNGSGAVGGGALFPDDFSSVSRNGCWMCSKHGAVAAAAVSEFSRCPDLLQEVVCSHARLSRLSFTLGCAPTGNRTRGTRVALALPPPCLHLHSGTDRSVKPLGGTHLDHGAFSYRYCVQC